MPQFLTFTGKSATGKTTLVRHLRSRSHRVWLVPSITTRPKRFTDLNGEYVYLSKDEFQYLYENDEFLWDVEVAGNRYGTRREDVDQVWEKKNNTVGVMILTPDVLPRFQEYLATRFKGRISADIWTPLLISVPDELRAQRLRARGDSHATIAARNKLEADWNKHPALFEVPFCHIINDGTAEESMRDIRIRAGF